MFIVYSQNMDKSHRIYDITLHKSYEAARKELNRRNKTVNTNDVWVGIREVEKVSVLKR